MFDALIRRVRFLRPLLLAVRRLGAHDGVEIAGFTAYTALVSLFPFVIFLFALAGFLGDAHTAQQVINAAFRALPREVASTLVPVVREIFRQEQPGLLTVGILGTLWATSAGIEALRRGTMRGWEMPETRPLWRRRMGGLLIVALAGLCLLSGGTLLAIAPAVMGEIEHLLFLEDTLFLAVTWLLRLAIAFTLVGGTLATLYRYLPPMTIPWRYVWRGAALATTGWLLLAGLFSFYLAHSGDYTVTYGSLGGVVITLLFLHFSAMLFLLGVEFNAVLLTPPGIKVMEVIESAARAQ